LGYRQHQIASRHEVSVEVDIVVEAIVGAQSPQESSRYGDARVRSEAESATLVGGKLSHIAVSKIYRLLSSVRHCRSLEAVDDEFFHGLAVGRKRLASHSSEGRPSHI
jgi:hypothetical protein